MQTKAERAAITYKNGKVKKMNDFYLYHKDIIDEYHKLQKEVSAASSTLNRIKINKTNLLLEGPF